MKTNKLWSIMMMLVLVLGTAIAFSSCSDDEDMENTSTTYDIVGRWEEAHTGDVEYLELVFNKNGKGEYNVYYGNFLEQDFVITYEYNKDKGKIKVVFLEVEDDTETWDVSFTDENTMWVTVNDMKLKMIRQ